MPKRRCSHIPSQQVPAIKSTSIDLDESIQRLVVVGDLHAYREPLVAVDRYLEELTDRHLVFVNGDLFEGGIDAAVTVDWVREHATGRTSRGNHDRGVFDYLSNQASKSSPVQSALDTESGSYESLSSEQLEFVADLPDQLIVRWRNKKVRILHGHQNLKNAEYTSWRSTVDQLTELFIDTRVDLTVIGHTHYPFAHKRDGTWVANSGSVAVPICRLRSAAGREIENRCATDDTVSNDDIQSSLLSITDSAGELDVQVVRFDYDRTGLLDRYARRDDLNMPLALRKVWVLQAFHDAQAIAAVI